MDNPNVNLFELQIDHQGNAFLKEAAKWARFLSIVGFVFCGIGVVFALFGGSMVATLMSQSGDVASSGIARGAGIIVTIFYLFFFVLYFFPCLYLFNFATKMKVALASNDMETLNASFRNLKACFRFVGILTIVLLVLMIFPIMIQLAVLL